MKSFFSVLVIILIRCNIAAILCRTPLCFQNNSDPLGHGEGVMWVLALDPLGLAGPCFSVLLIMLLLSLI